MVIEVYDSQFNFIDEILHYESAIFTPRYNYIGDFELKVPYTNRYEQILQKDFWIHRYGDTQFYLITSFEKVTDEEEIDYILINGQDSLCMLKKRIIIGQLDYEGTYGGFIKSLIIDNIIDPDDANRRISNVFISQDEPAEFNTPLSIQTTYSNLWETIQPLLIELEVGIEVICVNPGEFVFHFYKGSDRSEYVSFDKDTNNLSNIKINMSTDEYSNVAYVAGEKPSEDIELDYITNNDIDIITGGS